MYNTSGATIRGDINIKVEEAAAADRFYIGQMVLPMLGVDVKSGSYAKLTKTASGLLNTGATIRRPKSEYARTGRAWTSDTYDCVDRGLEEAVDDSEAKDIGRFFNAEVATAKYVLRAMMLDYEIRVASAIMASGTFTATAAVVNYTETLIATIDIRKDIGKAIERLADKGVQANTIVLNATLMEQQTRATKTIAAAKANIRASDATPIVTSNTLQQIFADQGITQVLVGRARYNGAKQGQDYSASLAWPSTYIWVGDVQGGPADAGGAGRTFVWNEEGGLFVTETYREDKLRSNIVRVRQNTTEKIIDASAGELITTNYSAS